MSLNEAAETSAHIKDNFSDAVSISVIIPAYNESATIADVVEKVNSVASDAGWEYEILVVDDASTDGTQEALLQFQGRDHIKVLTHEKNSGKGAAIRTALEAATLELVIIQDADLEYHPEDIQSLIDTMDDTNNVVYGSRVLGAEAQIAPYRKNIFAVGVEVLNVAVRFIYGIRLTDEATCYKLFKTDDLKDMQLTCEGFEFCPEVTAKSVRLGLNIKEIPIQYSPRSVEEGKKIRFKDAVIAMHTLWRLRAWQPAEVTVTNTVSAEHTTSGT